MYVSGSLGKLCWLLGMMFGVTFVSSILKNAVVAKDLFSGHK